MSQQKKVPGIVLISGVILCLLVIVAIAMNPATSSYVNQTEFNSEKWKTWVQAEDTMTLRWDMMDDLTDNYELEGMTEVEVIDLLGEPSYISNKEWTYDLGMARYGIDTGTLELKFDGGKVKGYEVRHG